jgi:lipopolysaccharide biosynthesis regulator YciM
MSSDEYFRLGVEMAGRNDIAAAMDALEECLVLNPDHAPACKELARLSLQVNEVRAFANWLHEAQRIDEGDPEPNIMLAEHLVERKRWEEADGEVRSALRKVLTPDQVDRLARAQARIPEYF